MKAKLQVDENGDIADVCMECENSFWCDVCNCWHCSVEMWHIGKCERDDHGRTKEDV